MASPYDPPKASLRAHFAAQYSEVWPASAELVKANGIKRLRTKVNELTFIPNLNFAVIVPLVKLFFLISRLLERSYPFLYGCRGDEQDWRESHEKRFVWFLVKVAKAVLRYWLYRWICKYLVMVLVMSLLNSWWQFCQALVNSLKLICFLSFTCSCLHVQNDWA